MIPQPLSWSAEHDASYAAMSLMWAVSQLDSMRDLFADGFAFEVFLQNLVRTMSVSPYRLPAWMVLTRMAWA